MKPHSVIGKLASSLNRRDENPNIELALSIADREDRREIEELVENLSNTSAKVQNDCIKVLYEIGRKKPRLIAGYAQSFLGLLSSRNNRLVWGAMTALDTIALEEPGAISRNMARIVDVANRGSVITRDHAVSILTKLASIKEYEGKALPLLSEQLERCPGNQLPMYAEALLPIINTRNRGFFVKVLNSRLEGIEKESKRVRVERVLRKISEHDS